jgi:3-phenylpropionate/trans-cinnamate dioxygenase ferredoxin subunit
MEWTKVADAGEVAEGQVATFTVGERQIAVANVGGDLVAFEDTCSHRRCALSEGPLDGTTITCPCHGASFDVQTGDVLTGPATEPIDVFEVRVEGGGIEVAVD